MSTASTGTQLLRWILDALLVGLIIIVLLGVALGRLVPLTGRETLIIGGASMEPAIPLGAAIVDEPVTAGDLHVGDIVSLRSGPDLRNIFTHRITRLVERPDGTWVETKGDANRTIDPSITPASNVVGRVVTTLPLGGYLLKLLSMPAGVVFVICLGGVLFAMTWLLETLELERRPRRARPAAAPPRPRASRRIDGHAAGRD
jgi:signal peptidase I